MRDQTTWLERHCDYVQSRLDDQALMYVRLRAAFIARCEADGMTRTEAEAELRRVHEEADRA